MLLFFLITGIFGALAGLFYLAYIYDQKNNGMTSPEEDSKFSQAVQAWNKGNLEKSESVLNELLKTKPDFLDGYLYLCKIYKKQQRRESLSTVYRHLLHSGLFHLPVAEEATMYKELADLCFEAQLWEEAFCNYLQAQRLKSNNDVRARLAFLQGSQGKTTSALATFAELLAVQPDNKEWSRHYTYCLMSSGMWEEASERLLDMISTQRDFPEYYYLLGRCFWHMGQNDLCRNYLKQYLRYPVQYKSFVMDAFILVLPEFYHSNDVISSKKNMRYWIAVFEMIMSSFRLTDEQNNELLWQLGLLYFLCGDADNWERAKKILRELRTVAPDYKQVDMVTEALINEDDSFDFAGFYLRHKAFDTGNFGFPKEINYQDLFLVRSFDIDALQGSFQDTDFFKKFFVSRNRLTVAELLSLPLQQFELRLAQTLKKIGWKIHKTCARTEDGTTLKYIVESDGRELRLAVVYRSDMTVGEIELNNILSERANLGVEGLLAISLGVFSPDAQALAKKNNTKLITGEELVAKT